MFMAVTPNTDLYLLQCPIELDNRNQINFSTADAQFNYFYNLPKLEAENFTYQRKDSIIRFPAHIDSLLNYTYVMYRNTNYGSKWFYAYITDMQYINDNMTAITISTDVWQTWCFNLSIKKSFVEREHVENDAFGLHTMPEGMESGEYIVNAYNEYELGATINDCYIAVQVSDMPDEVKTLYGNARRVYGGLPSGCWVLLLDPNYFENLNNLVKWWDATDKTDGIVSMYLLPKSYAPNAIPLSFQDTTSTYGFDARLLPPTNSATTIGTATFTRNSTLNGYRPVNNKLLCYPYNYLLITNNGGADIDFHWEDFSTSNANFSISGIPNQGCDMKLIPTNYKNTGSDAGYIWNVSSQKLPTISWLSDYYLNWQATNGVNAVVQSVNKTVNEFNANDLNTTEGVVDAVGGGIVNFIGYAGQVFKSIHSATDQYEASITPDQSKGNANTGDINFSMGKISFTGYKMSIKAEYAKVIDDFFTMYGYKVNSVRVPQFTSRSNWNYIKTIGINIEAQIPQGDLQSIKEIFNNGVTMWHNPSTFMDYSQSNNIV